MMTRQTDQCLPAQKVCNNINRIKDDRIQGVGAPLAIDAVERGQLIHNDDGEKHALSVFRENELKC